jgi:hypothetical protein
VLPIPDSVCQICRIPQEKVFQSRIETPIAGFIVATADLCDGCRTFLNRRRTTLESFELTGLVAQTIHGFQISWCLVCGDDLRPDDAALSRAYDNCIKCRKEETSEEASSTSVGSANLVRIAHKTSRTSNVRGM